MNFESDGTVRVMRGGDVGVLDLRIGDRLFLRRPRADDLLLLVPRGLGRPMLGRRRGGELRVAPSGAQASPVRWAVAGGIRCVERPLKGMAAGARERYVSVILHSAVTMDQTLIDRLRAELTGGRMLAQERAALAERLCTLARRHGLRAAMGVADSPDRAMALLSDAPSDVVRLAVPCDVRQGARRVVQGPWAVIGENQVEQGPGQVQLSLFGDSTAKDRQPGRVRQRRGACQTSTCSMVALPLSV